MARWIWMSVGELIVLLTLLDVFLTVLYARAGTSIIVGAVAQWLWRGFRLLAWALPWRNAVLSVCGPVILLCMVLTWSSLLTLGTAMVLYPNLGKSVSDTTGPSDTSFPTAIYAAGISLSVIGASNYTPQTTAFRMYYLSNSVVGTSVLSLTLTYLMQVYNALQRRATLAQRMHLSTGETGDAADLVAGIGPDGQFQSGYSRLSEMAAEITGLRETFNLYPVLLYFRYREPQYALSRIMLLSLEPATLIKSALDDESLRWMKNSAAVDELWRGTMGMVTELDTQLMNRHADDQDRREAAMPTPAWRARYAAALQRLREAGIAVTQDAGTGAENYIALRERWQRYIASFADYMDYGLPQIDPRGGDPAVGRHEVFDTRMHSPG